MRRNLFIAGILSTLVVPGALADEGMWTFDNFPSQMVKEKYGVVIDQEWLDHARGNAGRMANGCSSSLVSKDGLVFTNHHCVIGCVQNLSTPENDYVANGFYTHARVEERQCPAYQIEYLETIGDVTERVLDATSSRLVEEFTDARDAIIATIESESCGPREETHRCQVVTLYQGGQYKLYVYRKYTDVRLVFSPEIQASFFGGDPDNFNFPRYAFDGSFLRLYENGMPVSTPNHFRWGMEVIKAGDPVFVAGNPGSTSRLYTESQLRSLRDFIYSDLMLQYSELRGRLVEFGKIDAEHARIATRDLFGIENTLKRMRGQFKALLNKDLFESKRAADTELRTLVEADAELAARIGDPWGEIAEAQAVRAGIYMTNYLVEGRGGFGSDLYGHAVDLVRASIEREKPNEERMPEYAEARLPLLERRLLAEEPIEPELEALKLEFWLTKLREYLAADAPETAIFIGRESPKSLAQSLSQSRLVDPSYRRMLWEGSAVEIEASNDPMIIYVRERDAAARTIREQYEKHVEGPTDRAMERIAEARFAIYGTDVYPDATFTLRLSYGVIDGWSVNKQSVLPFTYFEGLYNRATDYPPFNLVPSWAEAQTALNLDTIYNISSTNDIVGGNSGSPLLNADGAVIGAVFDGNILSLGGTFSFDPEVNRAVTVSTMAITEGLEKVYRLEGLVTELMAP
jgi:hypothetical protein